MWSFSYQRLIAFSTLKMLCSTNLWRNWNNTDSNTLFISKAIPTNRYEKIHYIMDTRLNQNRWTSSSSIPIVGGSSIPILRVATNRRVHKESSENSSIESNRLLRTYFYFKIIGRSSVFSIEGLCMYSKSCLTWLMFSKNFNNLLTLTCWWNMLLPHCWKMQETVVFLLTIKKMN